MGSILGTCTIDTVIKAVAAHDLTLQKTNSNNSEHYYCCGEDHIHCHHIAKTNILTVVFATENDRTNQALILKKKELGRTYVGKVYEFPYQFFISDVFEEPFTKFMPQDGNVIGEAEFMFMHVK